MDGRIENSLYQIMPYGMYDCTHAKGCMYNRVIQSWNEKVWKSHVEGTLRSAIILDRMESPTHLDFSDTVDELETRITSISAGFTSVCQPYNEGIMKPFKARFTKLFQGRKVAKYDRLGKSGKIHRRNRLKF